MTLAFVHPPMGQTPTGGHRYNQRIIAAAAKQKLELEPVSCSQVYPEQCNSLTGTYRLVLWDSLFFEDLSSCVVSWGSLPSVLLCHYLPSKNPLLDATQSNYWLSMEKRVLSSMRAVIATGKVVQDAVEDIIPIEKVYCCEPGVEEIFVADQHNPQTINSTPSFLTVANLLPEKGYEDLLFSLNQINDVAWRWHIVGDYQLNRHFTKEFWQQIKCYNLSNYIEYHGVKEAHEIQKIMAQCDFFVQTSHFESYGMALAEAVAHKMPIISTTVGAAEQLVWSGINGLLVPINDPTKLSVALQKLITNAGLRQTFRNNHYVKTRTWTACTDQFFDICDDIMTSLER